MTWFENLTGFQETNPDQVRKNITVDGEKLSCHANGKTWVYGRLETPSLSELRERVQVVKQGAGRISLRELVANVQNLHAEVANAGAIFQVASQFNLLEMASPGYTPEKGVGIYEYDHTQGPACAIAAGAGTIYRNYFAPVNGQIGQTGDNQIDCLADLGRALGNSDGSLWQMQNGYALASHNGLVEISRRLQAAGEKELDDLRKLLRIGIQWHTQVTLGDSTHLVSQVYCSALPVGYGEHAPELWEDFARLVLEAAYEATICCGILNWQNTGNKRVFLTLLGGGAFGNKPAWIIDSIQRALQLSAAWDLDVVIVSYGGSKPYVRQLLTSQ